MQAVGGATYTLRSIQQSLGIPKATISRLVDAGFVSPARGKRNEYRFTFQDMVLLRTAYELQEARIPGRKILSSLQRLRASLPDSVPLSGLRITAVGGHVVVRQGGQRITAESGQLLLDFEVAERDGTVAVLSRMDPGERSAADWFIEAEKLEATDRGAAEAAYREALQRDPAYADAYLNLGALLCEAGRCEDAVTLYDSAVRHCPGEALLHFNRAIALEDLGRSPDAAGSYERALDLSPDLADAHYNLAALYQSMERPQDAIRHWSAYRRLQK